SQFLNFQDLSFHGVSVSNRHCSQRSGGQWLRCEVSLITGSTTRRTTRRLDWRVASLIISTNSGLLAISRSVRNATPTPGQFAPKTLTTCFRNISRLREGAPLHPLF